MLDVAHVHDLTAVGLMNIVTFSTNLRTLLCHDCMPVEILDTINRAIIYPRNVPCPDAELNHHPQKSETVLPSFHHLSCGWGFGAKILKAIWASSPWLVTFKCSIGATLSNCGLAHLAQSCPHLQQLAIESAPVCSQGTPSYIVDIKEFFPTSPKIVFDLEPRYCFDGLQIAGISHVLRSCPALHTLQLLRCAGPFHDGMIADLSSLHRVGMREVCIVWGSGKLTDAGLGELIGTAKPSLKHLELVGCR